MQVRCEISEVVGISPVAMFSCISRYVRGVDLCKNVGASKLHSLLPAGETKILNSAVTKQCLLNMPYIIGVKINVDSC